MSDNPTEATGGPAPTLDHESPATQAPGLPTLPVTTERPGLPALPEPTSAPPADPNVGTFAVRVWLTDTDRRERRPHKFAPGVIPGFREYVDGIPYERVGRASGPLPGQGQDDVEVEERDLYVIVQ